MSTLKGLAIALNRHKPEEYCNIAIFRRPESLMQLSPSPAIALSQPLSWLLWPIALLAGVVIALGSLSYDPGGRINVLWIWLLWAGIPLLGSLVSLWAILFGGRRPWLFQWRGLSGRDHSVRWQPSPLQRLEMLALLQRLWCLVALGMLVGFWALLLLSDLAFGWSSTLIADNRMVLRLARAIAWPWHWFWPAAVPDTALIEATRFIRISPAGGNSDFAGAWWRFLMASLLCYNLLPRLALRAVIALRKRRLGAHELSVRSPGIAAAQATQEEPSQEPSRKDSLAQWQDAAIVSWEIKPSNVNSEGLESPDLQALTGGEVLYLGIGDWKSDEHALEQLLQQGPERLLWRVNASRSPVAELSDLIVMARSAGVKSQALLAVTNHTTDALRHLASWRIFANKQQLVLLKDSA